MKRVMLAAASIWSNPDSEESMIIAGRRLERAGQALLVMWHLEEVCTLLVIALRRLTVGC